MVKDIPQIVRIQEAITKAKVSPKKKAILKGQHPERRQYQFGGLEGRADIGVISSVKS